jgi:SAM-dependent methyltransferase
MYPTAQDFNWRASASAGPVEAVLECDEWKYVTPICRIGIFGQDTRTLLQTANLSESKILRASLLGVETGASEDDAEGEAVDSSSSLLEPIHYRIQIEESLEVESLTEDTQQRYEMFKKLYQSIDGASISQRDRADEELAGNSSFTYGEVEFVSFIKLLRQATPAAGETFCDLGCGTGKALFIAAMSPFGFDRVMGIELMPGLYQAAAATHQLFADSLGELQGVSDGAPPIEIVKGDMTLVDWSDADIVYTSSICFSEELIQSIAECAKRMKPGSRFMTLKLLPNVEDYFEIASQGWYKMSWGRINVHMMRRTAFDYPFSG